MYFVGFYSVPNLIVILFNLLYHVFIVGFDCKGYVLERKCEDSSKWILKGSRASISLLSFLRSEVCALHMTRMRRVSARWRQLCFASISQVRPSRKTPARHFVLLVCTIWYIIFVPTLYIPTLPINVDECFWEKTIAKHLES